DQDARVRSPEWQRSWQYGLNRLLARVRAAGSARQSARRENRPGSERRGRSRLADGGCDGSGDLVAGYQEMASQPDAVSRRELEALQLALAQHDRLLDPRIHRSVWP